MKIFGLHCVAAVLPFLLLLFSTNGYCQQRVNCQWGPFDSWSECDGCTKSQTRSRAMAVYSQFGGNPCDGERTETQPCETTKACPLEEGCGDRFRCGSGQCISKTLVCNGDQDCEQDGLDEHVCLIAKHIVCKHSVPPPNIEHLGNGFDVVTGQSRVSVINTKSFGGQCRTTFSGDRKMEYRLPQASIQYNFLEGVDNPIIEENSPFPVICPTLYFGLDRIWTHKSYFNDPETKHKQVKIQSDYSDEMFESKWSYTKDIVKRETVSGTTSGHRNYDYSQKWNTSQGHRLVVLKNDIEVAQFQCNSPQYLQLSEDFWKYLKKLPAVYDYSAYRKMIKRFGTHYVSEGSLGGNIRAYIGLDTETEKRIVSESSDYHECKRTKRWILFFPLTIEKCETDSDKHNSKKDFEKLLSFKKIDILGGASSHIAALETMEHDNPGKNSKVYSDWADSITSFPEIIKQKLRPLSELVKEVQCAGVKRVYLRRAIEQYLAESNACHCRSCHNNGLAVMYEDQCKCICKPNTSGEACEEGTQVDGQQGVVDGRWTCWSSWSVCSRSQRSRWRSCSNPSPLLGGQHCIGESTEKSDCEDQDLEDLKMTEPECFDLNLPAVQRCETPPPLINGYILDPKDYYHVGNKIAYMCIEGFHLLGNSLLECSANSTWSAKPGICTVSMCKMGLLADGVIATPLKSFHDIGDSVTLSCPDGRQLQGDAIVRCDASLHFSPDPASITCSPVQNLPPETSTVECKPWQKVISGQCVCKFPYECSSSLELCATSPTGGRSFLLNVCKMHALICMGKNHIIVEDSTCNWPQRNTADCTGCHMWEKCDGQTNSCGCKDSADCLSQGTDVCVRVGEDENAASQTMNECAAGLRRCRGEKVTVVSIQPCTS